MNGIFRKISQFYIFLRFLSIDIVLGAVSGCYFASTLFDVHPSIYFWITLVSAVWVIYTSDHILDGFRSKKEFVFETYRFHYYNRIVLISIGIVVIIVSAFFVFFYLEKKIIIYGIYTFILVAIYLLLNYFLKKKHRFFPKELIIAVLYTWGIFGGVLILKGNINIFQAVVIFNYFLLVFSNVLLLSYFNSEKDAISNFNTVAVNFGKIFTRKLIYIILFLGFLISIIVGAWYGKWLILIIFGCMNLTLFLTVIFPSYFKNNGYYGIVADAIFFYPAAIIWVVTI